MPWTLQDSIDEISNQHFSEKELKDLRSLIKNDSVLMKKEISANPLRLCAEHFCMGLSLELSAKKCRQYEIMLKREIAKRKPKERRFFQRKKVTKKPEALSEELLLLIVMLERVKKTKERIKVRSRKANLYNMASTGLFILSSITGTLSTIPFLAFLSPAYYALAFFAYYTWERSIHNDTSFSEESKALVKEQLEKTRNLNRISAYVGMPAVLSYAATFATPFLFPPALPFMLIVSAAVTMASYSFWARATLKEYHRIRDHGEWKPSRGAELNSALATVFYSSFCTFGTSVTLLGAALLLASAVFPPLGLAAGAITIAGLAATALSVVSFITAKYYAYQAHKIEKQIPTAPPLTPTPAPEQEVRFGLGLGPAAPTVKVDRKREEKTQLESQLESQLEVRQESPQMLHHFEGLDQKNIVEKTIKKKKEPPPPPEPPRPE